MVKDLKDVDVFLTNMIKRNKIEANKELKRRRNKQLKVNEAPIGSKLQEKNFNNFKVIKENKEAYETMKQFAMQLKKQERNLLLMGDTGRGKTHLASAVRNHLVTQNYSVLFGNVIEIALYLKEAQGAWSNYEAIYFLDNIDLLVLDDLGQEPDFYNLLIYHIIDYLVENDKKFIIVSRKSIPELFKKLGEDTMTRILEISDIVNIGGENQRLVKYFKHRRDGVNARF